MALKLRREVRDEALHLFSAAVPVLNRLTFAIVADATVSFKALTALQVEKFPVYNSFMPNQNPLAGVVPQVIHPRIEGETAVTEYIEKIEGPRS
ncbi:MAG: hypothetical protein WBW14_14130 [Candidatus Acidiferrum sp.]